MRHRSVFCYWLLKITFVARVNAIMEKDSKKDPESNPNALLAKVLIGQVVLFCQILFCCY